MTPLLEDDRFRTREALYQRIAPTFAGRRVLEVGCGSGFAAVPLVAAGVKSFLGHDQNQRLVTFASRRFGRDGVRFAVAPGNDGASIASLVADADAVLALDWLPGEADPEASLAAIGKALPDRGRLVVSVPAIAFPAELAEARRVAPDRRHLFVWYWRAMMESAFGDVRVLRFHPPAETWPNLASRAPSGLQASDYELEELSAAGFRDGQPALAAVLVGEGPKPR